MHKKLVQSIQNKINPRFLITHKRLLSSFGELFMESGVIRSITIQNISERARVNRVTFYAHFTDKYALLYEWKRDLFKQILDKKLENESTFNDFFIRKLIDAVLDGLTLYYQYRRRINIEFEPLFESAMQQELTDTIFTSLKKSSLKQDKAYSSYTIIFISWAIFGSASEWTKNPKKLSQTTFVEQLVADIMKILA